AGHLRVHVPVFWRARRLPPSAPIQGAPYACPPHYAGLQAIVRPLAAAIGEVHFTLRNRLTPWAGSFAISRRRPCWVVSSPSANGWTCAHSRSSGLSATSLFTIANLRSSPVTEKPSP